MTCSAMAEHERIIMSKYTEEFKRNALERMKEVGITKASRELKVAHCTIYRWCQEMEGRASETEDPPADLDAAIEKTIADEQPPPEANSAQETPNESSGCSDTIATAMALLVIENTHLREVIKHLRDTISGLTDHGLI